MSATALQPTRARCGGTVQRPRLREGPFSLVACPACDRTYVTPRLVNEQLIERVYDACTGPHSWRGACTSS